MTDLTASQQVPNRNSTVDRAAYEQSPGSISTVEPGSISTVTGQHVNSKPTVEMRSQGDYQEDLSGGIKTSQDDFCRFDYAGRTAASSAPGARVLDFTGSQHVNQKLRTEQVYPMRPKGKVVQRPKPVVGGVLPNQKQPQPRPRGVITKGEKPLPPNWRCYPAAFKGLVDERGNWLGKGKVPRCKLCDGLLHPNENHVCPGYIEQLPFKDMPAHIERMQDQREEHHELIANGRTSRRKQIECNRCGEPLLNEEHALEHTEDCPGYMSL